MTKVVWLTVLSALEVLVFVAALVYFLYRITAALAHIGGSPDSSLAKLSFGLRAIERETSYLTPQVTQLNHGLATLVGDLQTSDEHLRSVVAALTHESAE